MKKLLLPLLLVTIQSVNGQSLADSLSIAIEKSVEEGPLVGLGVAILTTDTVIYKRGFGFANRENNTPYTTDLFQPIGSISKTLLGVSLLKAQELGMLKMEDPINNYLSFKVQSPHTSKAITIRHLATHTSGIKDTEHYDKAYLFQDSLPPTSNASLNKVIKTYNANQPLELKDFLSSIYSKGGKWYKKKNFFKADPGHQYEYSNNGAALASLVIEAVSGMSYVRFIREYILDPLNMERTGWKMATLPTSDKVKLYAYDYPIPDFELITYADGGLVTSIDELVPYVMDNMRGYYSLPSILLKPASTKEMFTQQFNASDSYGLFWVVGDKRIGHTGGDPGVTTAALFNRSTGTGIIMFSNSSGEMVGEAFGKLFTLIDSYAERLNR